MKRIAAAVLMSLIAFPVMAHHSVLNFDGKKQVQISGVVKKARFGFPHSKYQIEVTAEDGSIELWTLTTEDPRDAERLGFAEAIRAIKPGDEIKVIGWPHKFEEHEIRGHQLLYPDGSIVMMRRGNYIWPKDILRLDKLYYNPQDIALEIKAVDASLPFARQLVIWIDEGDHVARAAWEASQERPRLIGVSINGQVAFDGVDELLVCHTRRDDFTVVVDIATLDDEAGNSIEEGEEYIAEYNRVLSRWWEQEHASCE